MSSPQRNRQGASLAAFQPMQNEALGLSIHPINNESSPPMGAIPAKVAAAVANAQPSSQRGSQIRVPSGPSAAPGPSQFSQEHRPASTPSPSHTASPPTAAPGYLPQSQPLQQSPPQMAQPGPQINNYSWLPQNRAAVPVVNPGAPNPSAAAGSRVTDSWLPPDSDISPDALSRNKKPPVEERDGSPLQALQQSPPRTTDWNAGQAWTTNGGYVDAAAAQRLSPTSQLQSGTTAANRNTGSAQYAPNRNRPRGPTQTSSSPVMMQAMAIRQHQLQQSPPNPPSSHPPSASSSQVRGTPPSVLQGLIPPRDLQPTQPYLPRSQSENVSATVVSSNARLVNTPPSTYQPTHRETTSPPSGRGVLTGPSSTYHTPQESPDDQTRTSYLSATSSSTDFQRLPFEYDQYGQDEQDYTHPDPHGRVRREGYRQQGSPEVQARALPNPPVQQMPARQPQASSSVGSGFRIPMRFPVHEEVDDDVPQGPPPPPVQQAPAPKPVERQPSPPPAPPTQHPPIPIFSPQSIQAAAPQVLRDNHRDSTPSPPAQLRVNPDGSAHKPDDDLDPAVESSDNFTPKSPNVALPVDHGMTYTNTNAGRYGQRMAPRSNGTPLYNMHHSQFAMQMGVLPAVRGPLASMRAIYNHSPNFTSLGGAAAALTTSKPESPYPAVPPINTDVNGTGTRSASGYGPSGESGNVTGAGHYEQQPYIDPEHWTYQDFVNWQQRVYSSRPDAPIPPTPQSYASPQQQHHPRDPYGQDIRNQNGGGNPNANGSSANLGFGAPAYGNGYGPPTTFDPSMIPDRYIPSALSSYLSSPMMHNPFLPRFPAPQSLVSSPSHIPLDLPLAPTGRRLHKKKSKKHLRGGGSGAGGSAKGAKGPSKLSQPPQVAQHIEEPPRVDSTVPKDSSSEESDTDDTKKGESGPDRKGSGPKPMGPINGTGMETSEDEDDEEVWLDEDSEDELDAEFHSKYIQNPSKRKRKWEQKWEAMVRLFQELDRSTDSTMLLLAAPSTAASPQTHVLISRSIQRNPGRYMGHAQTARKAFLEVTKGRRKEKAEAAAAERARRTAGFEQQLASMAFLGPRFDDAASGGRGSSSPGSSGLTPGLGALEKLQELPHLAAGGEDGLKQALSVALESLKQMHLIYESREERRREEMERQRQESAGLEYLFRAASLDMPVPGTVTATAGSPAGSTGSRGLSGKKSP